MIPLDEYSFKYVGHREVRTEDDIRRAREAREVKGSSGRSCAREQK